MHWGLCKRTKREAWLQRHIQGRAGDDGSRDWGSAATSQGTPRAPRSWKRREAFLLEPSEGGWPCGHVSFQFLVPGNETT